MQKERVMLRVAGGIPYELTRGRVKRLNLHVRRDGTVALSIPLRTTLEALTPTSLPRRSGYGPHRPGRPPAKSGRRSCLTRRPPWPTSRP